MSNLTEASSARTRGRFEGVPWRCWCGEAIVLKLSKSDGNPYRRFFRCAYAASNRCKDDNHVFKWLEEAILSEIECLDSKIHTLNQELSTARLENEKIQREFESDILQRVETVIIDGKDWFKKVVVVLFVVFGIGCIVFKVLA